MDSSETNSQSNSHSATDSSPEHDFETMTIHRAYERIIGEQAARIEDLKEALDHERRQSRSLIELLAQGSRSGTPAAIPSASKPATPNPNRTVPLTQPLPAAIPPPNAGLLKRPLREPRRAQQATQHSQQDEANQEAATARTTGKRIGERTQLLSAEELRAGFSTLEAEESLLSTAIPAPDEKLAFEEPDSNIDTEALLAANFETAEILAVHADLQERAKKRSKSRPALWQRVRSFLSDEKTEIVSTEPEENSTEHQAPE